jgi:hypothetical protein
VILARSPKFSTQPQGRPLPKVVEGLAREVCSLDGHRFDHNAKATKQRIALKEDFRTEFDSQ